MNTVNWNKVLNETGVDGLRDFCTGSMTRREFESLGTYSRRLVRCLGSDEVRTRGKRVLTLRRVSV